MKINPVALFVYDQMFYFSCLLLIEVNYAGNKEKNVLIRSSMNLTFYQRVKFLLKVYFVIIEIGLEFNNRIYYI